MRGLSAKGAKGLPQVPPMGFQPDWNRLGGVAGGPPDEMREGAATTSSCIVPCFVEINLWISYSHAQTRVSFAVMSC